MSVFSWVPDFSAQKNVKPAVSNVKFGDGYRQRVSFGVNSTPATWQLQFGQRDAAEADAIEAFLEECAGVEAFEWTPPGESVAKKWTCQDWSRSIQKANLYSLTAVFEQVFDP